MNSNNQRKRIQVPNVRVEEHIICDGYKFSFQCPKHFRTLSRTVVEGVSYCNDCERKVYLCKSPDDVASHASQDHCVAIPILVDQSQWKTFIMGKVEPIPDLTDSAIDLHRSFLRAIDESLTSKLRAYGFRGPRTKLIRKSTEFTETVEITTSTATSECRISHSVIFSEIKELPEPPTVTTFWQDFKFVNPVSKKMEPKQMYCERASDLIVCGGIYKPA